MHTLLKGLEKIAASADIPMLVAGDFNSEPGSAAHQLLVKQAGGSEPQGVSFNRVGQLGSRVFHECSPNVNLLSGCYGWRHGLHHNQMVVSLHLLLGGIGKESAPLTCWLT